jgi:hypothetical protein
MTFYQGKLTTTDRLSVSQECIEGGYESDEGSYRHRPHNFVVDLSFITLGILGLETITKYDYLVQIGFNSNANSLKISYNKNTNKKC